MQYDRISMDCIYGLKFYNPKGSLIKYLIQKF